MNASVNTRMEEAKFYMNELVYLNADIPSENEQAHSYIAHLMMAKDDLQDMGARDSFVDLCASRATSAMNKFNY